MTYSNGESLVFCTKMVARLDAAHWIKSLDIHIKQSLRGQIRELIEELDDCSWRDAVETLALKGRDREVLNQNLSKKKCDDGPRLRSKRSAAVCKGHLFRQLSVDGSYII